MRSGSSPRHSTMSVVASSWRVPAWCSRIARLSRRSVSGAGPTGSRLARHQLDEARRAEEVAAGVAGLDDAVGVQQQPVAALQPLLADDRPRASSPSGGFTGSSSSLTTRLLRTRSAGGCPAVIQLHNPVRTSSWPTTGGDERVDAEGRREVLVHRTDGVDEVEPGPAGPAQGTERNGRQQRCLQAVTHRVDQRDVQHAAVERVVEAVTRHLVRRHENGGDGDLGRGEAERGQLRPLQLGRQRERHAAAHPLDRVAVEPSGHDELGDQRRDREAVRVDRSGVLEWLDEGHLEDAEALGPVENRRPHGGAVVRRRGVRHDVGERASASVPSIDTASRRYGVPLTRGISTVWS
jgi:hypothetical protein